MSAGTRSSAMTAQAPASSAMRAWAWPSDGPGELCGVIERYLLDVDDVHDDAPLTDDEVVTNRKAKG